MYFALRIYSLLYDLSASCSEHEIGGFYVDKCSNETKQWGITSIKNRFVQGILASALFLQIGIWVRNFAVLLYVMEMTKGDAFAISMISVAEFAPILFFHLLAVPLLIGGSQRRQ